MQVTDYTDVTRAERIVANELGLPVQNVCMVGSTLICGEGNDEDFLVLLPVPKYLEGFGYRRDRDIELYDSSFQSYRRGRRNIIAVWDLEFFTSEAAIAHCARAVNKGRLVSMESRDDRVAFHSEVRAIVAWYLGANPKADLKHPPKAPEPAPVETSIEELLS